MTERLCDLRGRRLAVACAPCGRRGLYDLASLRRRFGDHADLYDVSRHLTRSCDRAGPCRAEIALGGGDGRPGLPSRTWTYGAVTASACRR